jgi:hypothetical protein
MKELSVRQGKQASGLPLYQGKLRRTDPNVNAEE